MYASDGGKMNYLKKKELLIGLISFVLFLISSGLAIYFYFDIFNHQQVKNLNY